MHLPSSAVPVFFFGWSLGEKDGKSQLPSSRIISQRETFRICGFFLLKISAAKRFLVSKAQDQNPKIFFLAFMTEILHHLWYTIHIGLVNNRGKNYQAQLMSWIPCINKYLVSMNIRTGSLRVLWCQSNTKAPFSMIFPGASTTTIIVGREENSKEEARVFLGGWILNISDSQSFTLHTGPPFILSIFFHRFSMGCKKAGYVGNATRLWAAINEVGRASWCQKRS